MFNEKVLCLFGKNYEQLNKEGAKRGINRFFGVSHKNDQRMIAEIIYKDAYDAGHNDAVRDCPLKNPEPKVNQYSLYRVDDAQTYYMELTEEQARVIYWLKDNGILEDCDFDEWQSDIINVGRI